MPLEILESALESRTIRKAIGLRKINPLGTSEKKTDEKGGFLGWVLKGFGRLAGFLVGAIFNSLKRIVSFTLSSLWGGFVSAAQFIYNFNWNVSDEQIDQQVKSTWNSLGSVLGGAFGNALGWISCGVLPGAAVMAFNEGMGAYILKNVGEEFLEELAGNINAVVQFTFQAAAQSLFAWSFKNARKWLKRPNNLFAQVLFGDRYAAVMKAWSSNQAPSFSFAEAVEKRVEAIPNVFWRGFVSEFLEESWDACIEAGYVVVNSAESYMATQKLMNQQVLGPQRVVEVTPNRENESERIILSGSEAVLKPMIVQTLAQHHLIENRDMGQFVGAQVDEYQRAVPQSQRLVIQFCSVKQPPFRSIIHGKVQRVTIAVPNVPRAKMDWEQIKRACGGENGYNWGRFRAIARMSCGRQMKVYGATEAEAEKRLLALAELSESTILFHNVSEEKKSGKRLTNPDLQKEATQVYPTFVTVFVNREVVAGGRSMVDGSRRKQTSFRFKLWPKAKPKEFEEQLAELFQGNTV